MMDDFSVESLDQAVNSAYGKKKTFKNEDLIAPKKSSLSTFNESAGTVGETNDYEPELLNQAVMDAYKAKPSAPKTDQGATSFLSKLGQGAASLADVTVGGIIPSVAGMATYAGARAIGQTPEEAGKTQQQVVSAVDKPFGKAFGVTETPGYKGEATQQLMNFIGENIGKGADYISQATGVPKQDVEYYMGLAGIAGAPAVGKGLGVAGKVVGKELGIMGEGAKTAIQPMQEAFAKAKQKLPTVRFESTPAMKGMGAAEVDAARLRQERGNELLVPMGNDLTKSQITRNPGDVMFERETAKSPEYGQPLQEKYAMQNEKLQRNLQAEVDQTGAEMIGMDLPEFGKTLSDTFGKYKDQRYREVSDAYKLAQDAGETAQPVPYKSLTDLIQKETQGRPTKKAQNPLYAIVEEELKANDPSNTGKISINAMEDIRKLINEEADPTKKGTVRLSKQLRKEIDKSTENAGGDLYKEARAKNTAFESEFTDQGIIRDINQLKRGTTDRIVPLESLADKLIFKGTGADVKAVFATLEKMGPEGQQMAKELRGYAAEKIRQEATKGVGRDINGKPYVSTAVLDNQIKALDKSGKLDFLFGPKQAERYRTLNDFTKDLQTTPLGTVNTSGTTSTLLSALAEMGASAAITGVPAPIGTIATYGYKQYQGGKKAKKVQEYANPQTLSDLGTINVKGKP
jgi:hypothetical protein